MLNLPAIVTCLALVLYALLSLRVARARVRYNILAPATTGHPAFERCFRIQQNTGEQLIIMLPGLWLFSFLVSPNWACLLGAIWILGRIVYAVSYTREPQSRALGFAIAFLANAMLVLGSLAMAIWQYLR
jgi:glutathione S-transferase